ncbi:MAG: hypothetical protein HUJ11_03170, partial [Arenibacter algicola]|nr:hypothetical protein [Arenibacter algicola]
MLKNIKPHRTTPSRRRAFLGAFLALGAAFTLAGCPAAQLQAIPNFTPNLGPAPALPPAELPAYTPGDKYYYSNGARDQVVSVDGEMINMISRSGRKRTYFRNFALPTPYIEGSTKHYYKDIDAPVTVLWPLRVGNDASFRTQGRAISKESGQVNDYMQKWSCKVDGTEHVRVLAGEFDTYRVECRRYSATSGKWWETTTDYYAPELGTYVMRRKFHKKRGARIRQLTAVRPSLSDMTDDVRRNIIRTWQMTLEYKESGQLASWTDQASGVSVQVEPLHTFQADNGLLFRHRKTSLPTQGAPP